MVLFEGVADVGAAKVAADDVRLALAAVEEPAGLRCELGLVAGPAAHGSSLSVAEVVAAFERTAAAIRERIRDLGFPGVATFYVWHDEQAGQLRCSTGSVPPDALPFRSAYVASDALGPVVEGFLSDSEPGCIAWSDLDDVQSFSEQSETEPEIKPFGVWVSSVGASH
jgi:hypothetical protein